MRIEEVSRFIHQFFLAVFQQMNLLRLDGIVVGMINLSGDGQLFEKVLRHEALRNVHDEIEFLVGGENAGGEIGSTMRAGAEHLHHRAIKSRGFTLNSFDTDLFIRAGWRDCLLAFGSSQTE